MITDEELEYLNNRDTLAHINAFVKTQPSIFGNFPTACSILLVQQADDSRLHLYGECIALVGPNQTYTYNLPKLRKYLYMYDQYNVHRFINKYYAALQLPK